jgi:hypothetical protein
VLLAWAHVSDLLGLSGMTVPYANLLELARIRRRADLQGQDSRKLAERLEQISAGREGLPAPEWATLDGWIYEARKNPSIVT